MTAGKRQYFGTDGIRGKVGVEPITPDFIMRLGWAIGKVSQEGARGPVLIGKDTRISGYMLESALEAGLSAAGADISLLGPMPTPAIAFLTKNTRARAGIVISASHNPYFDNGIKIFFADGRKPPDFAELQIEAQMENAISVVDPGDLGKAHRISDAPRRYIEYCKSKTSIDLSGVHIVLDCANGAAYKVAPTVFEELGATVEAIGIEPDGFNINDDVGATSPQRLQKTVLDKKADLGIALDGDGDRLIMIDHRGERVDGDELIYIIAKQQRDTLNGGVVGTQMSNLGLQQAIEEMGLTFHRAPVGDRYVMALLEERALALGGEASGHIINLNYADSGDGIISALQIIEAMGERGESLHALKSKMKKYPQKLHNIALQKKVHLGDYPEIGNAIKDVEAQLGQSGRVLLRPSGTEPLLRIMVEGETDSQVALFMHTLTHCVEDAISK